MNDNMKYVFDKQLSRFDFYINGVNVKSAFIISLNTFVAGTLLLKYDTVPVMFHNDKIKCLVNIIFILLVPAIGLSLWHVLGAVKPFLKSGNDKGYTTLFFFKSVAETPFDTYRNAILSIDDDKLIEDLIRQTHVLADGASSKFQKMEKSMFWLLYFVVLPIALLFTLRVIDWLLI